MKNILIIYPHWPPSNLAGVHRARLIANFLPEFGWQPIVLTVHPDYYEEAHDWDIVKTVNPKTEVISTKAFKVGRPRLVGDIGLRGFYHLYNEAKKIISERSIDFIWIPIPSFYVALMGRLLFEKTGVKYGIDYIDPWVRDISGRNDWRHRLSNALAKLLEPVAVKKAALISGVSEGYYRPVLERNFKGKSIAHVAMPYGFDPKDHMVRIDRLKTPWPNDSERKIWLYAGAFLPNSRLFVDCLFKAIANLRSKKQWDESIELWFLGTGNYIGKSIEAYAEDANVSDVVHEDRSRFPFLHILNFISLADTVLVIGSTEKHYTASKIYQSVLSGSPVWAIFHQESTAVQVLTEAQADTYLVTYKDKLAPEDLIETIERSLVFRKEASVDWVPNMKSLDKYSSYTGTEQLIKAIDQVII